ncbi:MAG: hypothetical protein Ta2B_17710 [Termitinemataceae bacterium]|nr:MAG: hypothetical protein Ta2B_17710 [Termitinemataceae bacterium]
MRVEIAVAYHKPSILIENECLVPLQVGKDCSDFDLDMRADNTGNHISYKHGYAELRGIYWLWKNSKADIKGLFHYRRFLDLNANSKYRNDEYYEVDIHSNFLPHDFLKSLDIREERVMEILKDNVILTRNKGDLGTWSNYTVEGHYKAEHVGEHLDMAVDILKEFYPEYYKTAIDLLSGHVSYFTNMLVMKADDFDRYCCWLFDILDKVEEKINLYDKILAPDTTKARWAGFLGERLAAVFIQHQINSGLKVAEFPAVCLIPGKETRWYEVNTNDLNAYDKKSKSNLITIINNEKKENPKISVVIIAYNIEKYIAEAIESVINQSLKNIEIIVVNDGSTDATLNIIRSYAAKDKRITIIDQENQGSGYARNNGVKMAKGEYIHLMDGDDYIDYDFLESLVKNADKYGSDMVISTHRTFEDETNKVTSIFSLPHTLNKGYLNVDNNIDLLLVPNHLWDKIYKRLLIEDIKSPQGGGEDIEFWWKTVNKARNISVFRMPKYNYRIRAGSLQTNTLIVLDALNKAMDTQNFVLTAYTNKNIHEMFKIYKYCLVAHMIHRARSELKKDKTFRYKFFKASSEFLNFEDISLSSEIEKRKAFFYTDFDLIGKIKNETDFKKWTKLCGLDNASRFRRRVKSLFLKFLTLFLPCSSKRRAIVKKLYLELRKIVKKAYTMIRPPPPCITG